MESPLSLTVSVLTLPAGMGSVNKRNMMCIQLVAVYAYKCIMSIIILRYTVWSDKNFTCKLYCNIYCKESIVLIVTLLIAIYKCTQLVLMLEN